MWVINSITILVCWSIIYLFWFTIWSTCCSVNLFVYVHIYYILTIKQIHPGMNKENTVNDGPTCSGYLCLLGTWYLNTKGTLRQWSFSTLLIKSKIGCLQNCTTKAFVFQGIIWKFIWLIVIVCGLYMPINHVVFENISLVIWEVFYFTFI